MLINEVGIDVPQFQTVEVLRQTAPATQQRIVQTGVQYERAVGREVVGRVETSTMAGVYEAGVVGVRENVLVQPTVVERVSPIMSMSAGGMTEVVAAPTYIETFAAPTEAVAMEMLVAPTTYIA